MENTSKKTQSDKSLFELIENLKKSVEEYENLLNNFNEDLSIEVDFNTKEVFKIKD